MAWDLKDALDYYGAQGAPRDQSALVGFLRELQQENGGRIPRPLLTAAAEGWQVQESFLLAVVKRMPSLQLGEEHQLELCAGHSCGKAAALAAYAETLAGKGITVKFVPCMGQCAKGPNIKWDGKRFQEADISLLRRLVEAEK